MTDVVDLAAEIEAEHLARGLAAARAPFADGIAGECDGCGEDMPRLVGGLCGYCRDGRRPPLSRFDDPLPPRPESTTMTVKATSTSRAITVPTTGATLAAIERRAKEEDQPLGRVALALIETALAAPATIAPVAQAEATLTPRQRMVALLDGVSDLFIEQLEAAHAADRCAELESERDAAIARADAAEAKLERMRELMA